MTNRNWAVGISFFVLLGTLGCSDDDVTRDLRADDLAFTGAQLTQAMPLIASMARRFAPPDPPSGTVPVDDCVPVSQEFCESGTVSECTATDPDDVDIVIDECTETRGTSGGTLVIYDGTLTYSPGVDWPIGALAVILEDAFPGSIHYDVTLNGTADVRVLVNDTVNDIVAVCTGSLEPPHGVACS